jgi:hypothetical protein
MERAAAVKRAEKMLEEAADSGRMGRAERPKVLLEVQQAPASGME